MFDVRTIIELGPWMGASTTFLAKMLPDDGKIYAVDHFKGDGKQTSRSA